MGKLSEIEKSEVILKYQTGNYTCAALAREYNCLGCSIQELLSRRGIVIFNDRSKLRRKYSINENYFDVIDTEAKAYFLGLLYADGYNNEKKKIIKISLQEMDVDILEKFNKEIKSNNTLKFIHKKTKNHQNQYCLMIYNKRISEKLHELGCIQAKSLILEFPTEEQVPQHLQRHFIRGYFDGDGHFGLSEDGLRYSLSITSTYMFLERVQMIIQNEIGLNSKLFFCNKRYEKSTRALKMSSRLKIAKLLNWLYKDCNFYLQRKYQKYLNQDTEEIDRRKFNNLNK